MVESLGNWMVAILGHGANPLVWDAWGSWAHGHWVQSKGKACMHAWEDPIGGILRSKGLGP